MRGNISHKKEPIFTIKKDGAFIFIPILGDEIRELPGFLFTYFYSLSSSSHGMIYRSLERYFHVKYNAFEIVGIGSVIMEIFTYQFRVMGIEGYTGGNASKHPQMAF